MAIPSRADGTTIELTSTFTPGKRMGRQLFGTVVLQVITLALGALVLPLAARHWGPALFGRYVVAYRLLALLQPAVTLSANVSVTRHIARLRASDSSTATSVMLGAALIVALPVGGFSLLLLTFSQPIGHFLFGESGGDDVIRAIGSLLLGSVTYTVVLSALQGVFRIAAANFLALVYVGVAPLAALALFESVSDVLDFTALEWVLTSLVFCVLILARPSFSVARTAAVGLFRFGVRRIPGEIASFGLFALPPVMAAKSSGIAMAGFVSLGMSMVTLAGAACSPVSTVLLPHMSAEFADRARGRLKTTQRILFATNGMVLVGTVSVFFLLPQLLTVAFGPAYASALTPIRVACVAIPAFALYVTTRSIVDAYHERAMTMRFALAGFMMFAVAFAALWMMHVQQAELIAFDCGVWLLAVLTLVSALTLIRQSLAPDVDEA
jgi:O-antigen/teichoic acid export membrane protein